MDRQTDRFRSPYNQSMGSGMVRSSRGYSGSGSDLETNLPDYMPGPAPRKPAAPSRKQVGVGANETLADVLKRNRVATTTPMDVFQMARPKDMGNPALIAKRREERKATAEMNRQRRMQIAGMKSGIVFDGAGQLDMLASLAAQQMAANPQLAAATAVDARQLAEREAAGAFDRGPRFDLAKQTTEAELKALLGRDARDTRMQEATLAERQAAGEFERGPKFDYQKQMGEQELRALMQQRESESAYRDAQLRETQAAGEFQRGPAFKIQEQAAKTADEVARAGAGLSADPSMKYMENGMVFDQRYAEDPAQAAGMLDRLAMMDPSSKEYDAAMKGLAPSLQSIMDAAESNRVGFFEGWLTGSQPTIDRKNALRGRYQSMLDQLMNSAQRQRSAAPSMSQSDFDSSRRAMFGTL